MTEFDTEQTWRARGLRVALAAIVACCALTATKASAQYVVTKTTDNGQGNVAGSLSNAIQQANTSGGTITFNLDGGATSIILTGSMYGISAASAITINGGTGITINANGHQAFTVNSGNVSFQNLTIDGGRAQGGTGGTGNGGGGGGLGGGGAIYVDPLAGSVSVQNVTFSNNQAVGGTGGVGNTTVTNGGAGGGYNDNGLNPGPNTRLSGTGGGAGGQAGTNPPNTGFPNNGLPANLGDGNGAAGGYGGGGGGNSSTAANANQQSPGNGGGSGGISGRGGNGGLGLGGALFVGNGNTTTILGGTVIDISNTSSGGAGGTGTVGTGTAGTGSGGGLYVGIGSSAIFDNSTTDITISGNIYSNGHMTVSGGAAGTVNFFGSTITTTTGVGITVATGTLNGNTTSLVGRIQDDSVLRFTQTTTGSFTGTISGAGGVVVGGAGTLVLTTAQSYSGGTTVEAGAVLQGNTLGLQGSIENDSTVRFNQNSNGTYAGVIGGGGDLVKTGTGNLVFTGANTYSGVTTIDAGKLSINGSIGSDVVVNTGGSLGGTGTISGDVTNKGIIAPGNSIGTLNMNGTFTSAAGSTVQIEVNNAGTVAGVNNDLINVTGSAILNGGTVAVTTTTSVGFVAGSRYTFLQATQSLTGTFTGATINTPFLDVTLTYDYSNRHADFILTRSATDYAAVAQTFNQVQVATYLDQISPTANGDLATVFDQLNLLSAANARSAYDQMTGPINASAAQLSLLSANFMFQRIERNSGFEGDLGTPHNGYGRPIADNGASTNVVLVGYSQTAGTTLPVYRFDAGGGPRQIWNAWTSGYGSFSSGGSVVGNYGAAGNITSIYRYLNEVVKVGFFGAYNYVNLQTASPLQSNRTDDYQFGSYLRADDGDLHFLAAYSAGVDNFRTSRLVQFGNINRTALGNGNGWQNTAYFEVGKQIPVTGFDIEPFLGLQYTYVRRNGFQETGANSLNLNVNGLDADALWNLYGARMRANWLGGNFEFRTAWLYNYLSPSSIMTSTFAGAGGAGFSTQGIRLGHNATLIGGGATWNLTESLSLALDYDGYITAGNTMFHYGSGSVQYRW